MLKTNTVTRGLFVDLHQHEIKSFFPLLFFSRSALRGVFMRKVTVLNVKLWEEPAAEATREKECVVTAQKQEKCFQPKRANIESMLKRR